MSAGRVLTKEQRRARRDIQAMTPTRFAHRRHVLVESLTPNDDGTFNVRIDGGWMERWTLTQIKQAIASRMVVEGVMPS